MPMIVDRVFTSGLAQVAYLVADTDARVAAVIDPRRDVDAYLAWAATRDLTITAILETHVHADFVSGARELAAATGATIYASRLGNQEFPHHALDDGDAIAVGHFALQAFWTPGHTPEHMSYLLVEPDRGNRPAALFSGDLLFVGEVGRPDLLGAEHTRNLAEQLYDTFVHRLAPLHDDVVVYPGHTAGSSCGKKIGDAPQTTIGQERRFNYALQPAALASREAFIDTVLANMPTPPTYYPTMKRVNKVGPALLRDLPAGAPLSPAEVERSIAAGGLVVDARSTEAFARAHIPGSFYGGSDPDFVNWVGWLAPYDRDLILVLDDEARYPAVLTELRRIGLDSVAGYLDGGLAAWQASGRPVASTPTISVDTLSARLAHPDGLVVLDVRTAEEWNGGRIPGAVHRFAGEIARGAEIPVNGASEIAVTCASGYRSTVAISLLEARGRRNLVNVAGGMDAWRAARLPLETS
jgi:hydroxyacylglutathione hydrolase